MIKKSDDAAAARAAAAVDRKLTLSPLKEMIKPDACKYKLKPNKVIITLAKKKEALKWYDLLRKENAYSSDEEESAEDLPDLEDTEAADALVQEYNKKDDDDKDGDGAATTNKS